MIAKRCRAAGIPDDVVYRPKWRIGIDQIESAIGNGVRFAWMTFDEDYGKVPAFWFELDRLGQRSIGEVPANFHCWPRGRAIVLNRRPMRPSGWTTCAGSVRFPGPEMEAGAYQGHHAGSDDLGDQERRGSTWWTPRPHRRGRRIDSIG
jgi:hypothetical protein